MPGARPTTVQAAVAALRVLVPNSARLASEQDEQVVRVAVDGRVEVRIGALALELAPVRRVRLMLDRVDDQSGLIFTFDAHFRSYLLRGRRLLRAILITVLANGG